MQEIINGELSISLPAGFDKMSSDDFRRSFGEVVDSPCGFWDKERHVIFVITWNRSNKFVRRLTTTKTIAKQAEKRLAKANKHQDFHSDGLFAVQVAGEKAHGVRYDYTAGTIPHNAETIVFFHDACCYTLYYYTREEGARENQAIHDTVLSSLSFV